MRILFKLSAILFCTAVHAAVVEREICTTLATDPRGELHVGFLSDGREDSSREFAIQFRKGPIRAFPFSGTCRPAVQTLAPGVFFVTVDSCGSALETEYLVIRGRSGTNDIEIVDALLPGQFFAADYQAGRVTNHAMPLRLRYIGQYEYPTMPSEIAMLASPHGFRFGTQPREVSLRDESYRLSQLVYQDLYRIGFKQSGVAEGTCGPFSKGTLAEAAVHDVNLCGHSRKNIYTALRYLQATPETRRPGIESRGAAAVRCTESGANITPIQAK